MSLSGKQVQLIFYKKHSYAQILWKKIYHRSLSLSVDLYLLIVYIIIYIYERVIKFWN